jgi:hypothetical protein
MVEVPPSGSSGKGTSTKPKTPPTKPKPNTTTPAAANPQGTTFLEALGLPGSFKFPTLQAVLPATVEKQLGQGGGGGGGGGGSPGSSVAAKGPLQKYAQSLLAKYGWSNQWGAFQSIVNAESGWNPSIQNTQGSGAYGIAQALGHGTAATRGSQSDAYGGYGLTDSQAKQANSGNGYMQLLWMMNYIRSRYGSPDAAWQYHLAHNSY